MEKLYKLTGPNGEAIHGGSGRWHLPQDDKPGAFMPMIQDVVPCESGYHLLRVQDISSWLKEGVLWEAEAASGVEVINADNKVVTSCARLVRRVGVLTQTAIQMVAVLAASRVLPIFEAVYPGDDRPRKAIEAAQVALINPSARSAARAADAAAARAADAAAARAAAAADAARAADAAAARSAAYAAAYAARSAADAAAADAARAAYAAADAARAAERVKQGEDVLRLITK